MEIKKEDCAIKYSKEKCEVVISGTMRLFGAEQYAEIAKVLDTAVADKAKALTMDITQLRFLNSCGINEIFKFLIALKKQNYTQLTIKGNSEYFWQKKTLLNFQKILPSTQIQI